MSYLSPQQKPRSLASLGMTIDGGLSIKVALLKLLRELNDFALRPAAIIG